MLEKFVPVHNDRRNLRILYTEHEYSDGIKITGWKDNFDQKPFDTNPYNPDNINYFLSHYKRFSDNNEANFTTTTSEMSNNLFNKMKANISKEVINYYTYNDNMTSSNNNENPSWPTMDYRTTMQKDYKCPHPSVMKPIPLTEAPFLQYRRLKLSYHPDFSENKFHDDKFNEQTCHLRQLKGARYSSYNPITNENG